MSRKKNTLPIVLLVSLALASAACRDLTAPRSQDTPTPSFTQGQDGTD